MYFTRASLPVRLVALGAVAVTALAGCSSSGHSSGSSKSSASQSASHGSSSTASSASPTYYVSIGDSYAAGYQPTGKGQGATTRNGFAYQLVTGAAVKGYQFTLENFGCAGATTTSVIKTPGCEAANLGPGATDYSPQTQAAAAEAFLRAHAGHVGLVTVSIGGNDVTACGVAANPTTCVITALATVKANLATLMTGLRAAAGTATPIVGITYPDVLLADDLLPAATSKSLASLSIVAFKSLINPALQDVYAASGAKFVDVTAATGAYGSMTDMTTVAGYGSIPTPVAKICQLTFMCQYTDIHPRTPGYALIAGLILATLPAK
jgi:lysophospholipase L1-like esterase